MTDAAPPAGPWSAVPLLEFSVRGRPVPQGSIRHLGAGRPAVHANAKTLKPWRELVQHAVEELIAERALEVPILGPIRLDLVFTVPKPKSAPKRCRIWPTTRPDRGKLARAVEDAIQFSGLIKDDSQFVSGDTVKTFPLEHPDALDVPGVLIRVGIVTDAPAIPGASVSMDELDSLVTNGTAYRLGAGIVDTPLPEIEDAEIPW